MVFKHKLTQAGEKEGIPFPSSVGHSVIDEDNFLRAHGMTDERGLTNLGRDKLALEDPNQNPDCGNCYGAGKPGTICCNSCEAVKTAYQQSGWRFMPQNIAQCVRESYRQTLEEQFSEEGGCQIYGKLFLSRASGHFHIAPHKSLALAGPSNSEASKSNPLLQLLELLSFTFDQFNITHTVNVLRFGDQFPGIRSPLDGQTRQIKDTHGMYQYYVKVVPTVYKYLDGRETESNQYSVTEHVRHLAPGSGRGVPGVYFYYEISPVQAVFEERRKSFIVFLTSVCAIIGGLFTVMGMVDAVLQFSLRFFKKSIL